MATLLRGKCLFSNLPHRLSMARLLSNGGNKDSTIGFIGLGNMGSPMAKNLIESGHQVMVYDVFPEVMEDFQKNGAQTAKTPAEVASKTQKIITMLPSSPNVLDVYNGDNGIFKAIQENTLLMDCSTIDSVVAKDMNDLAAQKGAIYLDSPVSGGIPAAAAGTLTFMIGGKTKGFEQAKEILQYLGKTVIHTGASGTGQAAKICNNMLLAISMIGTSEAYTLGISLGLDPKMIAQIINSSSGRCWSSDTYNPCPGVLEGVPSSNNYKGGFMTALMAKDLGLAQNASTSTKTATPMGSLALQIYRIMCYNGYSEMDFGSVFKFLQDDKKSN